MIFSAPNHILLCNVGRGSKSCHTAQRYRILYIFSFSHSIYKMSIVSVFLACHTLPTIINIIEVIDRVWLVQHTSALVYDIYILLMFINTLSVFVLFAVFAVPFRSELRTIWQSVSCLRFSGTLSLPNVIKSSFKRQNGDGQAGEASCDPQNLTPQPPNAEAHM